MAQIEREQVTYETSPSAGALMVYQYPQGHVYNHPVSERQLHPDIQALLRIIEEKYPVQEEVEAESEELFCLCLQAEGDGEGEMIECGNGTQCLRHWFHTKCIGMKELPPEDGKMIIHQ